MFSQAGLFAANRDALIQKLQAVLERYIPKTTLADFFRWACSERNPQREAWLGLSGIDQNVLLFVTLLNGMAEPEQVEQMMRRALPMAAYQVFEELSEKLCGAGSGSLSAASDRATVQCLAGAKLRAAELLKDVEPAAAGASLFGASRHPGRFRQIAELYVRDTGCGSVEEIDGSLWWLLVVKAESCREAAVSVRPTWLGPMVVQGLMDRFRRGGSPLADGSVPVSRRATAGADSSRALPAIAFYAALLEPVLRFETLRALPSDAAFAEALHVASMLVRLLKDAGTPLLTNDWVRLQLSLLLDQKTVGREGDDLAAVLTEESGACGDWLARIGPDAARGETNICLSGLLHLPPSVAIPRLCDRIDYLAGIFSSGRKYLERLAQDITIQVWSDGPGKLILRYLEFHELMCAGTADTGTAGKPGKPRIHADG